MITRADLIQKVAKQTGISKKDTKEVLDGLDTVILAEIGAGEEIKMTSFMTIGAKEMNERQGRNPKTGEAITIPARAKVYARFTKAIKDAANK